MFKFWKTNGHILSEVKAYVINKKKEHVKSPPDQT